MIWSVSTFARLRRNGLRSETGEFLHGCSLRDNRADRQWHPLLRLRQQRPGSSNAYGCLCPVGRRSCGWTCSPRASLLPRGRRSSRGTSSTPADATQNRHPRESWQCLRLRPFPRTAIEPGTASACTPGATLRPLATRAASRKSSMRPFVHEPMKTMSIGVPISFVPASDQCRRARPLHSGVRQDCRSFQVLGRSP